jgi:hypothetical protein
VCQPTEDRARAAHQKRFDRLLVLPLAKLEPALQWAAGEIASRDMKLDWVQLTDDLSIWERETTRLKWAEQFTETFERRQPC